MSMYYYKRRHKEEQGGSDNVTTLASLQPITEDEAVVENEQPKKKTIKIKK